MVTDGSPQFTRMKKRTKSDPILIGAIGICLLLLNSSSEKISHDVSRTFSDERNVRALSTSQNLSSLGVLPFLETSTFSGDHSFEASSIDLPAHHEDLQVFSSFSISDSINIDAHEQTKGAYTTAQMCRLDIQKWLNPLIDKFLEMGDEMPPLVDWVWDMGTHFLVNVKFHRVLSWNRRVFLQATWNWQDQFGNNFTVEDIMGRDQAIETARGNAVYAPSNKWGVTLARLQIPNSTNQKERSIPVSFWASNVEPPEKKQVRHWVYDLQPFVKCDKIEKELDTPAPGTKIGMCVRFRGDHHLLPPFIAYHRLLGVEHFWFYANEHFNITYLPVAPDVTYVPYQFVFSEHANKTRVTYTDGRIGQWNVPFQGDNFWQQDVQQHCLYRSKQHGLDWLMTNDADEYLWLNKTESQKLVKEEDMAETKGSILQHFLHQFENITTLGALAVEGWAFGQIGSRIENFNGTTQLPFDYSYRTEEPGVGGRRKLIYRVPTAKRIGVHWLLEGGKTVDLPISDIRWNHYRSPGRGIFGRNMNQSIVRDSSLQDAYRVAVLRSMRQDEYPTI